MNKKDNFQTKPAPDFSWSLSRHALLEECPRAYYYNYYTAHNGWLRDAPLDRKMAYALKNITNIYLLIGSLIHERAQDIINSIVNRNQLPSLSDLIKTTRDELRRAFMTHETKICFTDLQSIITRCMSIITEMAYPKKKDNG
ncbi:MAG: hypothetical protein ABIK31_02725 [candidate division WOR-3 bacterium]